MACQSWLELNITSVIKLLIETQEKPTLRLRILKDLILQLSLLWNHVKLPQQVERRLHHPLTQRCIYINVSFSLCPPVGS